jgi:predicted RNA binding protein YcfA (HicA-like mRNA interferase family)
MKQQELIRKIIELGAVFVRHGGNHDWYRNPMTGACQPIPRHREINELLAKSIIKKLS